MNQPLISVVMPTFNHALFIGEAIKSVLDQTYHHLELIIVDNHSKDDTEKIIHSFDDQIRCFIPIQMPEHHFT